MRLAAAPAPLTDVSQAGAPHGGLRRPVARAVVGRNHDVLETLFAQRHVGGEHLREPATRAEVTDVNAVVKAPRDGRELSRLLGQPLTGRRYRLCGDHEVACSTCSCRPGLQLAGRAGGQPAIDGGRCFWRRPMPCSATMAACSIVFLSSRTLPGQEWPDQHGLRFGIEPERRASTRRARGVRGSALGERSDPRSVAREAAARPE